MKNRLIEYSYVPLILSLIISFIAAMTHEPWIDEIYAWQISKFTFLDIFYEMRYEGHFALWSILLSPFSHSGLPLRTMGLISWTINAFTMIYFFKKAPFNVLVKNLVLFSVPFIYLNPSISRCYVLIPLFLFPMASLFSQMKSLMKNPEKETNAFVVSGILLALFTNTHVYSEGFALIYGIMMLYFTIKAWKHSSKSNKINCSVGLLIGMLGAFIALIQVIPSITYSSVFTNKESQFVLSDIKKIFEFLTGSGITGKKSIVFVAVIFVSISYFLLKKDFFSFLFLLVSNLYMAMICVFIYGAAVQNRAVMWFYFVIYSLWITTEKLHQQECKQHEIKVFADTKIIYGKQGILAVPSILLAVLTLFLLQPSKNFFDFSNLYSGESRFAYFIKDTVSQTEVLFCNPNSWNCAVMEYIPDYQFYNIKDGKALIPRADRVGLDDEQAEQYIYDIFRNNPDKNCVYIIDSDIYHHKTNFFERCQLPFEYETLYPQTEEQKEYFIQYFLIRVSRPDIDWNANQSN